MVDWRESMMNFRFLSGFYGIGGFCEGSERVETIFVSKNREIYVTHGSTHWLHVDETRGAYSKKKKHCRAYQMTPCVHVINIFSFSNLGTGEGRAKTNGESLGGPESCCHPTPPSLTNRNHLVDRGSCTCKHG